MVGQGYIVGALNTGAGRGLLIGEESPFLRRHFALNQGVLRGLVLSTLLQRRKTPRQSHHLAQHCRHKLGMLHRYIRSHNLDSKALTNRALRRGLRTVLFDDQPD
jgi:hypothetical protein